MIDMEVLRIKSLYKQPLVHIENSGGIYYTYDEYYDYSDFENKRNTLARELGNELSFFFYPSQKIYTPFKKKLGVFFEQSNTRYENGEIIFTKLDFNTNEFFVYKYNIKSEVLDEILNFDISDISLNYLRLSHNPLGIVYDNLASDFTEVLYPERLKIRRKSDEIFDFRLGDKFYFSRFEEEGIEINGEINSLYRYRDFYIIKNKDGEIIEEKEGNIIQMIDGKYIII